MKFGFYPRYAVLFILSFLLGVYIALYVHDNLIRPHGGDVLIVIVMYAFCRAFASPNPYRLILGVLLFSYAVELGQYFHLVDLLGLGRHPLARIIIGTTWSWLDMAAYTLGAGIVGGTCLLMDQLRKRRVPAAAVG